MIEGLLCVPKIVIRQKPNAVDVTDVGQLNRREPYTGQQDLSSRKRNECTGIR